MEQNNFNALRLLFAISVVVSHCYPLSGAVDGDYLNKLTHGQVSFSFIGLSGFFTISGYLCFRSMERSNTLLLYFWKRARRIYPALIVMLLLTIAGCSFIYDGNWINYWSQKSVWTYLSSNLLLVRQQPSITGVFATNPFNLAINGSLWSLFYEVVFYVGLATLYFFPKPLRIIVTSMLLIVLIVARYFFTARLGALHFIVSGSLVAEFAPFFFFGCLYSMVKIERIKGQWLLCGALVLLLTSSLYFGWFYYLKPFILPPLILLIGVNGFRPAVRWVNQLGDISYGIYIYSFPIQQTLEHYFHFQALQLMAPSLLLSALAGYASWHLIEKRALGR